MSRDLVELSCVPAAVRDESGERRRGSTARVHALALDAIGRPHPPFEEQRQLFEACEPPDGVGPFLAAAHCFARVHPSLTPVVREGELIVGASVGFPPYEFYYTDPATGKEDYAGFDMMLAKGIADLSRLEGF